MRYVARIQVGEIAAAHHLPGYPGPCAEPHGHNYGFEVTVGADALHQDMIVDFSLIKGVCRRLDHTSLNDDPDLAAPPHRPTTERLAEVVAGRIQRALDALPNRPRLLALAVSETRHHEVVFTP